MTFDNGVVTDYGFEWNDNLSSIENAFTGSDLDFAYGFNDASELTSQSVSDSQHMWHPTSDFTNEFGTANNLNQMQYSTASCGRLFKGYNENGCLTDDGVWKYEYDNENQLVSADDGTTTVDYVYDSQGRQIQKDVDGTKTRYVYSGWQRIADYNGTSDTLQNRYVYGDGLDEPLIKVSSGGVLTYMHADYLGTIVALTDNTGAVTNRYAYSPWGESDSMSGTTFGYTGQRYDAETGLYYYKNRYYSPELGRFLQVDPIEAANLYSYAGNNPLSFTDPMGLTPAGLSDAYIKYMQRELNKLAEESLKIPGYDKGKELGATAKGTVGSLEKNPFVIRTKTYDSVVWNPTLVEWFKIKDILMTHVQTDIRNGYQIKGEHYWKKADKVASEADSVRIWTITNHGQVFLYNPKTKTTWKWNVTKFGSQDPGDKIDPNNQYGVPEIAPNNLFKSYLPGGFYTVVIDPGCSCKKKKNIAAKPTPRPGIDADPRRGIFETGILVSEYGVPLIPSFAIGIPGIMIGA